MNKKVNGHNNPTLTLTNEILYLRGRNSIYYTRSNRNFLSAISSVLRVILVLTICIGISSHLYPQTSENRLTNINKAEMAVESAENQKAATAKDLAELKEKEAKEEAVNTQVELGDWYKDAGQIKEATAAYSIALTSQSKDVRDRAKTSLDQMIKDENSAKKKFFWNQIESVRDFTLPTVFAVVPLLILLILFRWAAKLYGKHKGENKLVIEPFTDSTERKVSENFLRVFECMHGIMHQYHRELLISGRSGLPMLTKSFDSKITELSEAVVPNGWNKLVSLTLSKTFQPEFILRGSLHADGANLGAFIILSKKSKIIRTWSKQIQVGGTDSLLDQQKDLAFDVLSYVKEHNDEWNAH